MHIGITEDDPDQLELLRQFGCDAYQGYLLGKPMPAEAVPGWLAAHARPSEATAAPTAASTAASPA